MWKVGRESIAKKKQKDEPLPTQLAKCPTGIKGLNEITNGGLPQGRPTLVCGGAGCGKTLLATEFIVPGAMEFGEPGLFVSFEESTEELGKNVTSLGAQVALQQCSILRTGSIYHAP